MLMVFISSPYTLGDVALNVKTQIDAADKLMDRGYCPLAPLLTHFQHMVHPRSYEDWLKIDFEYLSRSDVVLRLPGESSGADREVAHARKLGLPVVFSLEELYEKYPVSAPNSIKPKGAKPKLDQPMYGIGIETGCVGSESYGMTHGLTPSLQEMLDIYPGEGYSGEGYSKIISKIIRFDVDGSEKAIYSWDSSQEKWRSICADDPVADNSVDSLDFRSWPNLWGELDA